MEFSSKSPLSSSPRASRALSNLNICFVDGTPEDHEQVLDDNDLKKFIWSLMKPPSTSNGTYCRSTNEYEKMMLLLTPNIVKSKRSNRATTITETLITITEY